MDQHDVRRIRQDRSLEDIPRMYDRIGQGPDTADVQIDHLHMAGKTGTVQNPHGRDHAIFIGFAPLEDPQIAVAVVVENAGFGATWACPVATMMIEQYLTGEVKRKDLRKRIGSTVLNESVKKW